MRKTEARFVFARFPSAPLRDTAPHCVLCTICQANRGVLTPAYSWGFATTRSAQRENYTLSRLN